MPPVPPVCVSVNAVPAVPAAKVSTGVSEFSVTSTVVVPAALSDWARLTGSAPEQVNTPLPVEDSTHFLVK